MQDGQGIFDTSLEGMAWDAWLSALDELTEDAGDTDRLGEKHAAIRIDGNATLLVTFETFPGIMASPDQGRPLGWQMARALGWSQLCITAQRETWFRDNRVYGYFDRLVDDGFFDEFDQVIFYGAGSCGYAAAAFSVAAPGARVIMLKPHATLDPRVAEWDDRYLHMRRTSFTDRYGYAPDMLDAAREAFVLYDPENELEAMHAALFTRPNVTKFRTRFMSREMEPTLTRMNMILRMIAQASAGKLDRLALARLYRARREDPGYQFALLQRVVADDRPRLVQALCEFVLARRDTRPFRKALQNAQQKLAPTSQD